MKDWIVKLITLGQVCLLKLDGQRCLTLEAEIFNEQLLRQFYLSEQDVRENSLAKTNEGSQKLQELYL